VAEAGYADGKGRVPMGKVSGAVKRVNTPQVIYKEILFIEKSFEII